MLEVTGDSVAAGARKVTRKTKRSKKTSTAKKTKRKVKVSPRGRAKKRSLHHVDDEGLLCFTSHDLARYELAQHRVLNDSQAIKLRKSEIERANIEAAQKVAKLTSEIKMLVNAQKEHAVELKALQDEIGSTYNIDMSQVSYDDATGRIYLNGNPVSTG